MSSDLSKYKYLVFDVYGTLVDWESGIATALEPLLSRTEAGKTWTRAEALTAFTSVELDVQAREPTLLYSDVLAKSYDELKRRLTGQGSAPDAGSSTIAEVQVSHGAAGGGVTEAGTSAAGSSSSASTSTSTSTTMASSSSSSAATTQSHSPEATKFAASIAHWQPFPDTVAALAKLSSLGLKLIVLSNVDRKSFAHTQKLLEQGFTFSHIFTAEEIGTYKPNPNNHRHVLQQLATASGSESDSAFDPAQVLAVAQSLMHDHVPAQNLGLASAWINRSGAIMGLSGEGVPESEEAKRAFVQFKFETMAEFADAFAKAKGSV